jgi:UDP-2-acetamido-2,6-beta-L-arabino-hexul-4-ose reductase
MNILILGSNGFIGKNLHTHLKLKKKKVFSITKKTSKKDFKLKVNKADVIYHLAGSNREKNDKNFHKNNVDLTKKLYDAMEHKRKNVKIIYASTIHFNKDNIYGKTKKKSENILRKINNKNTKVIILRLPNIFGKWSKPNYNSAIATFCYKISRGLNVNLKINKKINLYYIDDLVNFLVGLLKINFTTNKVITHFKNVKQINLKLIIDKLYYFKNLDCNELPKNISDSFIKKLYATFIYFSPRKSLNCKIKKNIDERGEFAELVKSKKIGQFSFLKIYPNKIRGNHFHNTKIEYFFILKGTVKFYYTDLYDNKKNSFTVNEQNIKRVVSIPGVLHKIKNIGNKDALLVIWSNEIYDVNKPDTYNFIKK